MSNGLSVSRLINVQINLTPTGAQIANLTNLLILGDSPVINTAQRIRDYDDIDGVAADFGTSAPEYLAALLWFAQTPRPTSLSVGRWARAGSAGEMIGGALNSTQQALANFTAITTGAFKVTIDGGSETSVTGLNFSAATNLNGVAAIIDAALAGATVTWDASGGRFHIISGTTGATSTVSLTAAPSSGVDIRTIMGWNTGQGATTLAGIAAETAVAALAACDAKPNPFYGVAVAALAANMPNNAAMLAVAAYVEAAGDPHVLFATSMEAGALDPASTTDLAYMAHAAGYNRTFVQYSSSNVAAAVSAAARILPTNYNANSSVITLMYKQEPLITPETLTPTQANALEAKSANVFVNYDNDTAIIQYGTVASGLYMDEIAGTDWLKTRIQTDLYNALYSNPTKIPQTDAGNGILAAVIEKACAQGVSNGLLGAGEWTAGGFGQLKTGDFLTAGFYVYQPPISSQSVGDRAARRSVAFRVAAKLAGAIHRADVLVDVNR